VNKELLPGALVIFCFNFLMFFLVDKYFDLGLKYGSTWPPVLKQWLDRPWFRKLAKGAHIIFCILALLLPFVIPANSS
jgi:hypothetical protein